MRHMRAIVSSKGQVVIPRAVRKALGIHAGTELILQIHGNVLEARPAKKSIESFFGCCKEENDHILTVPEMDQAIQKAVNDDDIKNTRD